MRASGIVCVHAAVPFWGQFFGVYFSAEASPLCGGGGEGVEYISIDWRIHIDRCSVCVGLSSVVCVKAIMKTEGMYIYQHDCLKNYIKLWTTQIQHTYNTIIHAPFCIYRIPPK